AHDRKIDLRKLTDAHVPVAEVAKDHHGRRQHDGEDGILDAEVGELHLRSAALPSQVAVLGVSARALGFGHLSPRGPAEAAGSSPPPAPAPASCATPQPHNGRTPTK